VRLLGLSVIALLGLSIAAAWTVREEPDFYLRARYPLEYEHIIRGHAANHDLDPALVAAVVSVESGFDPNATSEAGAIGLMQLLPETAKGIALRTGGDRFVVSDLRDPEINVRYGSWYLDHLRTMYEGDVRLALAAYHAGPGSVDHWRSKGLGIPFPATRAYVEKVERLRAVYRDAYPSELGLR
jgi:soluble lytic murein transglycosylase